jgi:hypothetical protein
LRAVWRRLRLQAAHAAVHGAADEEGGEGHRMQLFRKRHHIELVDETLKHGRLSRVLLILRKH